MSYIQLVYLHLATILPAFVIGTYLLVTKKGTGRHRALGKGYMALMLTTALITLAMPAEVGPTVLDRFGFIHLLSLLVLVSVPIAYIAAKKSNVFLHGFCMINLYVGGLLIAGAFTVMPGRLMHQWLFG